MKIKQDPVSKLWCRSDGAVLMPPNGCHFKSFRWTFGSIDKYGYCVVKFHGKAYKVHQIVCRAFNGLAPEGKPEVDHIDRCKANNTPSNLRWASRKENVDNTGRVDQSIAKYGVRFCDDPKAYHKVRDKVYYEAHYEERKSHMRAYAAAKRAEMKAHRIRT